VNAVKLMKNENQKLFQIQT